MYLCFICQSEWTMYGVRDRLSAVLRRLKVKYISEPFYPASCRKFSVPKSEPSEYGVEFHIRIAPDDPRRSEVRQAAQHIADAAEEVIRLDIRM